jgi:dolichol-phosphate mannosyltransferase
MGIDISVVIPAYNEADTIDSSLRELDAYMRSNFDDSHWEIIVVNDGSNDGTLALVNALSAVVKNVCVADLGVHMGRGMALRKGIRLAKGEIIVSLDSDLSYSPDHIGRMVNAMHKQQADLVLASAYSPMGTVRNVPFNRYAISWLGNKILAFMFGGEVHTLTCLARAYRRDFIRRLDLHSYDKEIHLEILYKTKVMGGKILEVPADLCWREQKRGKLKARKTLRRRSTLTFQQTSVTHFFFALINRPGLIFWIPGYLFFLTSFLVFINILLQIAINYPLFDSIYLTLRDSMKNASPSWITLISTFVLGIQFFSLGFISAQNKYNHDEHYRTLNDIYNRLPHDKDDS